MASRNNHVISLLGFSSNTNPKWPVIVVFSNFSGVGLDGKDLICFQSEDGVFKFLLLRVDGAAVASIIYDYKSFIIIILGHKQMEQW